MYKWQLLCSTFQAHGKAGKMHLICGIGCWSGGRETGEVHLRWIWLSHGTKLMRIPRHHEWGSLGQGHRSSIEVRHLVSTSGEVLMLSDFSSARISSLSLYTHTHTELQEELCPVLWSTANPSRLNTGAHSLRCLHVIVYCILWALVMLLVCRYWNCAFAFLTGTDHWLILLF